MELPLPEFPLFEKLNIHHRCAIEQITHRYAPYSDFNFVSLLCYDTESQFQVSALNGNLVIKLLDYITLSPFYSFLGNNLVADTVEKLIALSKREQIEPIIKLVPEVNISNELDELKSKFMLKEDFDNCDYIVSVDNLISLNFGHNQKKKKYKERFIRRYPNHKFVELDISDSNNQNLILDLFYRWEKQREKSRNDTQIELTAINRLFQFSKELSLVGVGVFYNEKLIGFIVNEVAHEGYYLSHFGKYDLSFVGIGQFLESESARFMKKFGCVYMNNEQDLGIQGLKYYKQSWHPTAYLNKYTIGEYI